MIQVPVDPSILKFQQDLLQSPVFDAKDEDLFYQDLYSTQEDIWNFEAQEYPNLSCQAKYLAPDLTESLFKKDWTMGSDLVGTQTRPNSFCEGSSIGDADDIQQHDGADVMDFDLHSRFIQETARKIGQETKPSSKKPYRLDELFKKVIRALSLHMRNIFKEYLHGADLSKISESHMEEILKSFLITRYHLVDLEPSELLIGKKVLYSIAIKGRQTSFGSEFSMIIRNLRCEFVEIGTKKSGLAFFRTKVGKAVFWPVFRRVISRILDNGSSHLQLKYLVKSFGKFSDKIEA